MQLIEQKQVEKKSAVIANTPRVHMSHTDTLHMAKAVQCVENQTTSSKLVKTRGYRCQEMTKDTEQFMTHTKRMNK